MYWSLRKWRKNRLELKEYIVNLNATVLETLNRINENSREIAFVCDEERVFYGTVTDGDVRRYLLSGGEVGGSVMCVMNRTPYVIHYPKNENIDYEMIMREKVITAIPIIDNAGKLVDAISTYDYREEIPRIDVPVVIMAGGKGTRLRPYTDILPKPLIPIGNKTVTERIIDAFLENGCTRYYMIVNYKREFIKTYFQYGERNYTLTFVDEDEYQGTGGGLALLKGKINETFIVTNCDILIDDVYEKYLKEHKEKKNIVTIVAAKKNMQLPYGIMNVDENDELLEMEEKPKYSFLTNTGFYIIEPEFLEAIPDKTFIHMPDVIQKCMQEGKRVGVYQIEEEKWLDMGQFDEMEKMRQRFE